MKRNKKVAVLPVLLALMFVQGCTNNPIKSGNDPVVVRAEQALTVAPELFDLVVHVESDNRAYFMSINPDIHKFGETLRKVVATDPITGKPIRQAKFWLVSTTNMLDAYKDNRTAENKANLLTWLKTIEQAVAEAKKYAPALQAKATKS